MKRKTGEANGLVEWGLGRGRKRGTYRGIPDGVDGGDEGDGVDGVDGCEEGCCGWDGESTRVHTL